MTLSQPMPCPGDELAGLRIGDELAGAMTSSIHRATSLADPSRRWIVTAAIPQRELAADRVALTYELPGVASLEAIVDVHGPGGVVRLLIEREPPGTPMVEVAPVPELAAARMIGQLLEIVDAARVRGVVLRGLHPLLCYVHDGSLTQGAPRAFPFLMSASPARGGLCLRDIYSAPEEWRHESVTPAADVFSVCAIGLYLVTGQHPFPGTPSMNAGVAAVAQGSAPHPTRLGAILAGGLVREPGERPMPLTLTSAIAGARVS